MNDNLINRPQYLNQLIENKDIDETRIIHMNMESLKYRDLTDYLAFYNYISDRLEEGECSVARWQTGGAIENFWTHSV
jgi:hypothetical protein